MHTDQTYKATFFLSVVILIIYPCVYWTFYAGDAEIHLIYGENAAAGHFFEFNPGEKSSGLSSIAYMFFVGGLFKLFKVEYVPVFIKLFNYLAWYSLIFVFYKLLKYKNINKYIRLMSLLAFGLMPGSVYNSVIGMENVFLGLFTLIWFYFASKKGFFNLETQNSFENLFLEFVFGLSIGMCTWIRPEAIPFFIIALSTRLIFSFLTKQQFFSILIRTIVFGLSFIIPLLLLLTFNYFQNGTIIPSSVHARAFLDRTGYQIGPMIINFKALLRLVVYFPITLFWIKGVINVFNTKFLSKIDEIFAVVIFISFILSFTFAIGTGHLGRYMIFLMPFWILIAAKGLESIISKNRSSTFFFKIILFTLFICLSTIYIIENKLRLNLGGKGELYNVMHAPSNRVMYSDNLYKNLDSPAKLPIVIAFGEVQARYRLDNRFIVRSLDGRTDATMLHYIFKDKVDHVGYIKNRGIDYYVTDYSAALPIQKELSKEYLSKIKKGESFYLDGLKFTRINKSFFKITPTN